MTIRSAVGALLLVALSACGFLQKHEDELGKITAAVACMIQKEEFDNETFNEECDRILGYLTPAQREAVKAESARAGISNVKARRVAAPAPACGGKDGGL